MKKMAPRIVYNRSEEGKESVGGGGERVKFQKGGESSHQRYDEEPSFRSKSPRTGNTMDFGVQI
jgi:hypothetical protein